MISSALFLAWRIFQIIVLVPIVGMLGYFVHIFVHNNELTPDYILVMFIVATLALAWCVFTVISYLRARHDALFVALVDLGFVGAFIAGVYYLRGWANANCSSLSSSRTSSGFTISFSTSKICDMLKASFALGIIALITFFITFLLALLVARHHRDEDRTIVKREYRDHRTSRRSHGNRSRSRDYGGRSSRDYGYDRPSSGGRRSHHSTSRRQYYV